MRHWLTRVAAAAVLAAPALAGDDYDRWYEIEMDGQRSGWMHTIQNTTDEWIETLTDTRIDVKRGALTISITMSGAFRETPGGEPLWMESVQKLGANEIRQSFTFEDDGVWWVTRTGGQRTELRAPLPEGVWLTPAAATDYTEQRIAAGATEISVRTLDPSLGLEPVVATRKDPTPETITAKGREIEATRWVLTNSMTPGIESVEYTDADGNSIVSTMNIGGIALTMRATTREAALAELDPPEMMVSTLVEAGGPIEGARISRRASFLLRVPDGELPDLPTEGVQRVTRLDGRSARVDIDVDHPTPAGEIDREIMLGSSSMIDPGDAKVAELAKDATRVSSERPADRAEAIRRYVHRYVREKSLGVGFAGSGEVARTREGDCTEHAVLLAAMLRADDIPARVASGLIYVSRFAGAEDVFGYHMWAQALLEVDGEVCWVDLDATLGSEPFDATHIALVVTPLAEGQGPTAMAAMAPLLGRLEIEVESIE